MKTVILYLCTLSFLAICSCSKDKNINSTTELPGEVLLNSSFEKDGQPYNDGWNIEDESIESYSTDVPPGGGNYSLCLRGDTLNLLGQWAKFTAPAIAGNNVYQFSFWGKQQGACGVFYLYVKTSDTSGYYTKSQLACDSTWSNYSVIDTIQTNENDSLVLLIGGELAWMPDGKAYFDLCKLEKLNSN